MTKLILENPIPLDSVSIGISIEMNKIYFFLISVCEITHTKISKGIWSRFEGDSYLKAHGINNALRQNITE